MSDEFHPHPLLRGPHAQTLFPFFARRRTAPAWESERLELPDGDFLDLCHLGPEAGPRVCLFHGLEGCVESHYVGGLARALAGRGMRVTFMHFRGCSGVPNRRPRAYHSGETGDIGRLAATLRQRDGGDRPAAIGFSLGGNALLKYLGERGRHAEFSAAVAVSPPMRLAVAASRINAGFSRCYQWYLLDRMKRSTRARAQALGSLPINLAAMERSVSFREFDDAVTAPLHGFRNVDHYYSAASAAAWMPGIETETLVIHARDDPFLGPGGLPIAAAMPTCVRLEISDHGGHVGFIAANALGWPWRWLEQRIPRWLEGSPGR